MKPASESQTGPFRAKAWVTDEEFGYDHWRAAEYSCGRGTHFAVIYVFNSQQERDEYLAREIDANIKMQLIG